MRRVVLDTNVLVSALLFDGQPGEVLRLAVADELLAMTSPALLAELHSVLVAKFRFPLTTAELIVAEYQHICLVVEPTERVSTVTADPSDNRVLECALAAHADVIVSGDHHLLALRQFRGMPILSPQAFLAQRRLRKW